MFFRLLRLTIFIVVVSNLFFQSAFAQPGSWQYLPNTGLVLSSDLRLEDLFFTDTLTGYGVTLSGNIFNTTDGGNNWYASYSDAAGQLRSIEFLADKLTGISGSMNGARTLRTTDGGYSWTDISAAISDTLTDNPKAMCGLAHYGNNFYGAGWWGGKSAMFYRSTDKGVTWQTTYIDPALATGLVDIYFVSPDTGFATGGIIPVDSGIYSSTKSVVLKTTDGGLTWAQVFVDSFIGGRIWKIQYVNRQLMVGSIEPYYYHESVNMIKSTDGGNTWSIIHAGEFHNSNFPPNFSIIQGIGFLTPQIGYMGGYCNGMFETFDGGATWDSIAIGVNVNRIFVIDSNHAYAGGKAVYKWQREQNTGIGNVAAIKPVNTLYPVVPNPAKGKITIQFDIGLETNVVLEVANVDMRKATRLCSKRFAPGHYTYTWDGSNAPNGNYMVRLGTDEIPFVQKFVLEK